MNVLDAIGNTSMVRLQKVVPPYCGDVFVKLEWENPTGSVKDRMATAVISRAEELAVLSGGEPGPHKIEGVGLGYLPPLCEPSLVDHLVPIRTDDAKP